MRWLIVQDQACQLFADSRTSPGIDNAADALSTLAYPVAGTGGAICWHWSTLQGAENLLPYAAVQYGALASVLAIVMLFRSRYTHGAYIFGMLAMYAAAKASEALGAQIYALGGIVSGHKLKHPLTAFAVGWLLRMLRLRRLQ
jgi:hypothetical protein